MTRAPRPCLVYHGFLPPPPDTITCYGCCQLETHPTWRKMPLMKENRLNWRKLLPSASMSKKPKKQQVITVRVTWTCRLIVWWWKSGIKRKNKRNLLSPLSVWSLVSAGATRCQEGWTRGTGGGMVRWSCPRRPSSSPSGHPPTAGWRELRERKRERCQMGTITWSKLETRGGCCR